MRGSWGGEAFFSSLGRHTGATWNISYCPALSSSVMYGFPGVLIQSPAPDWFLVHFHHECGKNFTDVPFCVFTLILAVVGIWRIHYVHQQWSVLVRVCELMSDLPPIVWVFTRTPFIMCSVLQVLFSLAQKFNGQRCQCDKSCSNEFDPSFTLQVYLQSSQFGILN